jgi:hypothetical protein
MGYLNLPARNDRDTRDPGSIQATLANKVTELAAVRSEMICVMEAAARAELSRDLTARLGKTGKTATTPNPDDRHFNIQRPEDISNSQD